MKYSLLVAILLAIFTASAATNEQQGAIDEPSTSLLTLLTDKQWIHGAEDCDTSEDPGLEVFQYDESSYILRQSKCLSYEAPFIYVLVGDDKTLVIDTGATADEKAFPLYKTVLSLHKKHAGKKQHDESEILVIHSHSHSDHYSGDDQFRGKPNVTVVAASNAGIEEFYAFDKKSNQLVTLDLGGRSITIIPTPGHQDEAITVYDEQTKWLLTGDTFYPGYVYVKDWDAYKNSIARLTLFSNSHAVSAILGAHIERKSSVGEYYEVGTIYQPQESSLVLMPSDLNTLNDELKKTNTPKRISQNALIVEPLGFLPKLITNVVAWFIG